MEKFLLKPDLGKMCLLGSSFMCSWFLPLSTLSLGQIYNHYY